MPGSSPGTNELGKTEASDRIRASTPHRRGAVEAGGDRVERDLAPALGIHELFPTPIEEALVVLRDVALGNKSWTIRMRSRMPEAHRQVLRVPAREAARARQGHLAPVVDVVLLEHSRGAVVGLAADADRALDFLGRIPLQ